MHSHRIAKSILSPTPTPTESLQVEGLESQTLLTDLWLNNNKVAELDHLTEALQPCKASLQVLYLEATPAAKSTDAYLLLMKELLPSLEYLDSTPIKR